jgi:DNA modification methylase
MIELHNADCLDAMRLMEAGSIDAIITDPPYGTTACNWDSIIDFALMWEQLNRIIKKNGAIVLFGSEPFSSALRMSNIKKYKYDWIYRKPQGTDPLMARFRPMNDIENILVFHKKQPTYNAQLEKGKPYDVKRDKNGRRTEGMFIGDLKPTQTINKGTRQPKRVLDFKQEKGLHPTQKPVALMEYLIKTYTNENETVLDFTMGSGSTCVACLNTNRKFIGIEQDETYFQIAKKRIEDHQKQLRLFNEESLE